MIVITIEAACGWAMYFTASNAMLADLTSLRKRDEAYSISRVAANAGQAPARWPAACCWALA